MKTNYSLRVPLGESPLDALLYPKSLQGRSSALQGGPGPLGPPAVGSQAEPPPSITGAHVTEANSVRFGLDWLDSTLSLSGVQKYESCGNLSELVLLARRLLAVNMGVQESEFENAGHGRYGYQQVLAGPEGAEIWFDHPDREDIHIRLPGNAMGVCGTKGVVSLTASLFRRGGTFSRLDAVLDDYQWVQTPYDAYLAFEEGYGVSHSQDYEFRNPKSRKTGESKGEGFYLGSPASRQRLRCYNKLLESKGEQNCVRWELQCRDEASQTLAAQVTAAGLDGLAEVVKGRLRQMVDFRDKDGSGNTTRRSLLPWWLLLVGDAVKLAAYGPVALKLFTEKWDWFAKQYSAFLHVAVQVSGGDLTPILDLVKSGGDKLKAKHKRYLEEGYLNLCLPPSPELGVEGSHG